MSKMFVIEKRKIYKIKFNFFLKLRFDSIFFTFFFKKKESKYVIIKLNWIQSQKLIKFKHQFYVSSVNVCLKQFFLASASSSTIIHFTFIHFKNILTYYYFISNNFCCCCCCSNLTNLTASFLIAPVVCVCMCWLSHPLLSHIVCYYDAFCIYIRYSRVENL